MKPKVQNIRWIGPTTRTKKTFYQRTMGKSSGKSPLPTTVNDDDDSPPMIGNEQQQQQRKKNWRQIIIAFVSINILLLIFVVVMVALFAIQDDNDNTNNNEENKVVAESNNCIPNPCLNGGECIEMDGDDEDEAFECECPQGFLGKTCEGERAYYIPSPVTLPPDESTEPTCLEPPHEFTRFEIHPEICNTRYNWLGNSIAIDGSIAVMGNWCSPTEKIGTVSLFELNDLTKSWEYTADLTPSNGINDCPDFEACCNDFGVGSNSLAVSGNFVMVGDYASNHDKSGSVWVFHKKDPINDGGEWEDFQRLTGSNHNDGWEGKFGGAIDIDGDYAVITDTIRNKVYFFEFDNGSTSWKQVSMFVMEDGVYYRPLNVAISGPYAVVAVENKGLDIYERKIIGSDNNTGSWELQQVLPPVYRETSCTFACEYNSYSFSSVSISGNAILAGVKDLQKVHVYEKLTTTNNNNNQWQETGELTIPTDEEEEEVEPNQFGHNTEFGNSVAIDENRAVIGAWGKNNFWGGAYVFEKQATDDDWEKVVTFDWESDNTCSHCSCNFAEFGHDVAISGSAVLVAASADKSAHFYCLDESSDACPKTCSV